MTLSRRDVMKGAAGCALAGGMASGLAGPGRAAAGLSLRAGASQVQLAPAEYPATKVWAYDSQVPGPELRFKRGEMFSARLINDLPQETTIHWHGLRLPNGMDGVPGMTQAPVAPGEAFEYAFPLRDAGTFWYHPHAKSQEQISRGLSGVLVVEEDTPPDVDGDQVLVLDDWRLDDDAQIHDSFGNRHDMSHAGRLGNFITVNGQGELTQTHAPGARLRLRLVNVATARIFSLVFQGMKVWQVALDGMPLAMPEQITELDIAPAQRTDLIVDLSGEEALIGSVERDGTYATVTFKPEGAAIAARSAPAALPPNDMPVVDLAQARQVPLVMEGGAMRGLPDGAVWKGQKMELRALAQEGQFWAFNGMAGMPDAPLVDAFEGEVIRIPIENRSAFPHAMHLHGMHFREVLPGGDLGPWRDTLLVQRDETREIAFVAEAPGDWMFHCHMAAHQMAGMMSWIRVT